MSIKLKSMSVMTAHRRILTIATVSFAIALAVGTAVGLVGHGQVSSPAIFGEARTILTLASWDKGEIYKRRKPM
jgi:hypothetical protein